MNDIVAPYLEIEGIAAAALVSAQGLLVASAGDDAGVLAQGGAPPV